MRALPPQRARPTAEDETHRHMTMAVGPPAATRPPIAKPSTATSVPSVQLGKPANAIEIPAAARRAKSSSVALLLVLEVGHVTLTEGDGILVRRRGGGIIERTPAHARRHGIESEHEMLVHRGGESAVAVLRVLTVMYPVVAVEVQQLLRQLEDAMMTIGTGGGETTTSATDAAVGGTMMIVRAEGMMIGGNRGDMMTVRNLWRLIDTCLVGAAGWMTRRSRGGGRGAGVGTGVVIVIVSGRGIGSGVVRGRGLRRGRVMGTPRRRGRAAKVIDRWSLVSDLSSATS